MRGPGIYADYPSSAVSPYWCWFKDLNYPQLDLHFEDDGTWYIIQYINSPIIPSLTKWQAVLGPMRNVEPTPGFVEKYINKLDITKREYWAHEEARTKAVLDEAETRDKRDLLFQERATEAVMRNPGLVERVAKKGVKEIDLKYLGLRVPTHEVCKPAFKGVKVDVPDTSKHAIETVHAPIRTPVHEKP